jgi:yeast amino acid transporter
MEKEQYLVDANGTDNYVDQRRGSAREIVETKGAAIGEAADIYGDVATAEQYGYVQRGY